MRRLSELPAFDAVFDAVFRDATLEVDPHARRGQALGAQSGDTHLRVPKVAADRGCRGGSAVGHAAARGVDGR